MLQMPNLEKMLEMDLIVGKFIININFTTSDIVNRGIFQNSNQIHLIR